MCCLEPDRSAPKVASNNERARWGLQDKILLSKRIRILNVERVEVEKLLEATSQIIWLKVRIEGESVAHVVKE